MFFPTQSFLVEHYHYHKLLSKYEALKRMIEQMIGLEPL